MSILDKIKENRKTKITVCKDPLHGSPKEFEEDFNKAFWNLVTEAKNEGIRDEDILEAAARGTNEGKKELAGVMEARRS